MLASRVSSVSAVLRMNHDVSEKLQKLRLQPAHDDQQIQSVVMWSFDQVSLTHRWGSVVGSHG